MIFSTVSSLIEAVGRTRASNWGELDKLTCLWTGPTSQVDSIGMGATHPQYGNMEVNAIRKIADVAGVTKLELDYVGLFNGDTIGPIIQGSSASESELEYQMPAAVNTGVFYTNAISTPVGTQIVSQLYMWKIFTLSYVIRYLSRNATFRYVVKGLGGPIGGGGTIESTSIRPNGQSQPTYAVGSVSGPLFGLSYYLGFGPWGHTVDNYCSSFDAEPISPSWFRCTETWTARYIAGGGG
jgi:hypothetical protein